MRAAVFDHIAADRYLISISSYPVECLGACPTLTFLLRRMMRDHLRRSRPEKILNVFQRIHLRFFRACGLASGPISFTSSRTAMADRLLGLPRRCVFVGADPRHGPIIR